MWAWFVTSELNRVGSVLTFPYFSPVHSFLSAGVYNQFTPTCPSGLDSELERFPHFSLAFGETRSIGTAFGGIAHKHTKWGVGQVVGVPRDCDRGLSNGVRGEAKTVKLAVSFGQRSRENSRLIRRGFQSSLTGALCADVELDRTIQLQGPRNHIEYGTL